MTVTGECNRHVCTLNAGSRPGTAGPSGPIGRAGGAPGCTGYYLENLSEARDYTQLLLVGEHFGDGVILT